MRKTDVDDIISEMFSNISLYNKDGKDNTVLHSTISADLKRINKALSSNYKLAVFKYYREERKQIESDVNSSNTKDDIFYKIAGDDIYTQLFLQGMEEYCIDFENLTISGNEEIILAGNGQKYCNKNDFHHQKFIPDDVLDIFVSASEIFENDLVAVYFKLKLGKHFLIIKKDKK